MIYKKNTMMKSNLKYAAYIILFLTICSTGQISAQIPVRKGPASSEEIKNAKTALEANMDDQKAHKIYIYAMGVSNPLLVTQYKEWMKKYPENVNIPLAIGTVYYNAEMPEAKYFLLKAVSMAPKIAEIWSMLSVDAGTRGQNDLSTEYMKKASLADTSNADYAASYLMSFEKDGHDYSQKVFDFTTRFPKSERGAQLLYWLAEHAINIDDQINYFEKLRKLYSPKVFTWSASGMIHLADDYLQTAPEKAVTLIDSMGDGRDWKIRGRVAESLIKANKLEQNQNYKDAINELDQVTLPKFNYINNFIALKKAALKEKAGDVKAAYNSLAEKFAKLPTDQLYTSLESYGRKIGKDKGQVVQDIDTIRNRSAVPASPFELGLYTSSGTLKLESLKGKVVLLTFWFPACGPCREEFPHFQAVINKFKDKNVAYVGINVFPEQDPYVLSFMKNTKYSFIPLRGSSAFAGKYYGVRAEPENFLIDKSGKIIFRGFRIDNTSHRTLELMISSLLQKGQQSN
jgi:thiol-disulfide isomerase/thioredoxin